MKQHKDLAILIQWFRSLAAKQKKGFIIIIVLVIAILFEWSLLVIAILFEWSFVVIIGILLLASSANYKMLKKFQKYEKHIKNNLK